MNRFQDIPFDDIVAFGQRNLLYTDMFVTSWLLGRFCNYKCSYCWPYARSDTKDHRPTPVITSTMDEIKRQARERGYNSFHFSFSGGEPTLHPGILDIVEYYNSDAINTNTQSLHFTTNLSPGLRWWEKLVHKAQDLHRVSVTASWHREQGIKENNLPKFKEKFADKCVFLMENGVNVTINIVMVPEMFSEFYKEAEYFQSRGINVTLKPQSDPTASKVVDEYTSEQLQIIREGMPQRQYRQAISKVKRPEPNLNTFKEIQEETSGIPRTLEIEMIDSKGQNWYLDQAERFNAYDFNNFCGWTCEAGYRSIIIREPDGLVRRSYSCWDRPLGHVETGFTLFNKPSPCITPQCVSSADSKIPKRKKQ